MVGWPWRRLEESLFKLLWHHFFDEINFLPDFIISKGGLETAYNGLSLETVIWSATDQRKFEHFIRNKHLFKSHFQLRYSKQELEAVFPSFYSADLFHISTLHVTKQVDATRILKPTTNSRLRSSYGIQLNCIRIELHIKTQNPEKEDLTSRSVFDR